MKISLIDNYDSFTYNLVQLIKQTAQNSEIFLMKNDKIEKNIIENSQIIIISPGPDIPQNSGQLMEIIDKYHKQKIMLGICLGHQALGLYFGLELNRCEIHHGIKAKIEIIAQSPLFNGIENYFEAGLYHSWACSFPKENSKLIATSRFNNLLMSFEHKTLPIFGLQFHPESYMTNVGQKIFTNFFSFSEKFLYFSNS